MIVVSYLFAIMVTAFWCEDGAADTLHDAAMGIPKASVGYH